MVSFYPYHFFNTIFFFYNYPCVPDAVGNRLCLIYLRSLSVSVQTYLLTLAHDTDCPII